MEIYKIPQAQFEEKGHQVVFKQGKKQVLLLKLEDQLFALDNRCPHEGYPLAEGSTDKKSCVLTCNWHNWKFDLKSGKCLIGGDNVRTYPVKEEGSDIVVDLSDPTPEQIQKEITSGLKVAYEKRQFGRIARELARYSFNNLDPVYGLKQAILWSYDKFEYGTTHAFAVAADWLALYHDSESREDKIICLTESIDHIAYDALRHPVFPFTDEVQKYNRDILFDAVENEDEKTAIAQINGAIEEGKRYKDLEQILSEIALEHYNDFGHSLIYVLKSAQLAEFLDDPEVDRALLLAMTRSLVYATREDLIPEFNQYAETLNKLESQNVGSGSTASFTDLANKRVKDSYSWIIENYPKDSIEHLYQELLTANAYNFLTYDLKFQDATSNPVTQNVGWLSFTHAITFSNAVRIQCQKFPHLWPKGLVQMASFNGRNTAYTSSEISLSDWKVENVDKYKKEIFQIVTDHGLPMPIFSAHLVKTGLAVFEEYELATEKGRDLLLASLNRFLRSPLKGKHVRRLVHQGINLVAKDF